MSEPIWHQLEGDYPDLNLRLRELLFSGRIQAAFLGQYGNSRENEREALIHLFWEDEDHSGQRVARLLESTFFEHPNILRNFAAGTLSRGEFTFTYAVTERAEPAPARFVDEEEAIEFTNHVISALRYLHSKNLVYCALSPQTVVRSGRDWKLGDFSELRVSGSDERSGTLSLAARFDTTPPEAVEGVISSAWDVWSLGQTLRRLVGYPPSTYTRLPQRRDDIGHFPQDPVRSVVLACLNVNPSSRPTLDQLASLLYPAEPANSTANRSLPGL